MADIVLPATQFLEHDDLYKGGGHQYLMLGPKAVEPPEGPRENIFVINEIARRVDSKPHPGFDMSARDHIDWLLRNSNYGTLADLEAGKWIDLQPDFETAHYLNGFGHADGKFHFKADWGHSSAPNKPEDGTIFGPWQTMPELPDQWDSIELARRAASVPLGDIASSLFPEFHVQRDRQLEEEGRPTGGLVASGRGRAFRHRRRCQGEDGQPARCRDFACAICCNRRARNLISEGIWPNDAFEDGRGINTLTGADPVAPYGGAAFHDTAVWVRAV